MCVDGDMRGIETDRKWKVVALVSSVEGLGNR